MKNLLSLFRKQEEPLPATGPDGETLIYSPLGGRVVPVTTMKDQVFVQELLGKGVAVEPQVGRLTAPVGGTLSVLYPSGHALCITTPDGLELLLHIGEDTVQLGGKHFTTHARQGDQVQAGQLLVEFDAQAIRQAGYTVTTPVLVLIPDRYADIQLAPAADITPDQVLLRVYPRRA